MIVDDCVAGPTIVSGGPSGIQKDVRRRQGPARRPAHPRCLPGRECAGLAPPCGRIQLAQGHPAHHREARIPEACGRRRLDRWPESQSAQAPRPDRCRATGQALQRMPEQGVRQSFGTESRVKPWGLGVRVSNRTRIDEFRSPSPRECAICAVRAHGPSARSTAARVDDPPCFPEREPQGARWGVGCGDRATGVWHAMGGAFRTGNVRRSIDGWRRPGGAHRVRGRDTQFSPGQALELDFPFRGVTPPTR